MEVKQTIESTEENRKTEKVTKIESKLTTAEQNREKEIQRKLEIIKKNEKRAEAVRQNKANLLAQGTPSSG
jgi:stathmin